MLASNLPAGSAKLQHEMMMMMRMRNTDNQDENMSANNIFVLRISVFFHPANIINQKKVKSNEDFMILGESLINCISPLPRSESCAGLGPNWWSLCSILTNAFKFQDRWMLSHLQMIFQWRTYNHKFSDSQMDLFPANVFSVQDRN